MGGFLGGLLQKIIAHRPLLGMLPYWISLLLIYPETFESLEAPHQLKLFGGNDPRRRYLNLTDVL